MSEDGLDRRRALMVLNALPGMGPVTLGRLLAAFGGDPRAVLGAGAARLAAVPEVSALAAASAGNWRAHFDPSREESLLARHGAEFLARGDPGFPPLLSEQAVPPIGLYRRGGYNLQGPCVAVIGSRRATRYGRKMARSIAAGLAAAGYCVVAGLARGIDTEAHEGALEAGGRTVAVLGNGLDIVYPPENAGLCARIVETGAVVSEFPMGRPADRQSFAIRNRIISGMSRLVVVVESDLDGGSMITVKFALEQGRLVCAVPGRADEDTSRGCHRLIRDGATLVTSAAEVLEELRYPCVVAAEAQEREAAPAPVVAGDEARVLACLRGGESVSVDELVGRLGGEAGAHGGTLLMLEMKGLVAHRPDGRYERS